MLPLPTILIFKVFAGLEAREFRRDGKAVAIANREKGL